MFAGDESVKDSFEVVVTDLAGQVVIEDHDILIFRHGPCRS